MKNHIPYFYTRTTGRAIQKKKSMRFNVWLTCHHIFNSEDVIIVYIKNICLYLAVGFRILSEWDWFIYKLMCSKMKNYFWL
jgi:hypothetical protein